MWFGPRGTGGGAACLLVSQVIQGGASPPDRGFRLLVPHFFRRPGLSQGLATLSPREPRAHCRAPRSTWQGQSQRLLQACLREVAGGVLPAQEPGPVPVGVVVACDLGQDLLGFWASVSSSVRCGRWDMRLWRPCPEALKRGPEPQGGPGCSPGVFLGPCSPGFGVSD